MRNFSLFSKSGMRGAILLRVVLIILTLSIICGTLFAVISTVQRSQQANYRKARDISEYGLTVALLKLGEQPSWSEGFQKTRYDDGFYRVSMQRRSENGKVVLSIVSEGLIKPMTSVKEECVLNLNIVNGDSAWVRESIH